MAYLKLFTLGLAPGLNGPDIQSLQKGARGARSECRMRCWHWFKAQHQTIKPGRANLNLESLLLRMLAAPIFQRQNCGLCGLLDTGSSAAAQEANTMDKRFACFFFTCLASRFSPRMGPLARSSVQCTVRILEDVPRLSEFESHQSLADRKFGYSILWIPYDVVCGSATPTKHFLPVPHPSTILVDSRQKIVSVSLAPRFTPIQMI
ncbi:hypothetical protein CMEL01_01826 [Colletotrichum melonis]|uniref:Uncharacterized protein n=1 Tax=Colletotrichum melonis TaxID=1209925 RepID=A0AAI9V7A5_9PEZI|nr:hypothetical protein CMEL01_01826 [Colletotrichum melonis]